MQELLESLCREARDLDDTASQGGLSLDAYLYQSRMRCGKPACRCMTSEYRHALWCVSYTADGRSHTRTVQEQDLTEVRGMCERYRRLRGLRKRLLAVVERAVLALDRQIRREAAKGWKRFEQIKGQPRRSGSAKTGAATLQVP